MKILYVSSNHPSLEYDDLVMLQQLGLDWFSTGVYSSPRQPLKSFMTRSPIDKEPNPHLIEIFKRGNPSYVPFENSYVNISQELLDEGKFDAVWVTHTFPNIENNWKAIKSLPVIWRTYNQQLPEWERKAKDYKLTVVRMGSTERTRKTLSWPGHIIRAYVDDKVFEGWEGKEDRILTFYNRFYQRLRQSKNLCPSYYCLVRSLMSKLNFELYGFPGNTGNEGDFTLRYTSQKEQLDLYNSSMIYFSLNSESAVYTNSLMEAAMMGMPIVTFGSEVSNTKDPELRFSYEVPYLFNEDEIVIADSVEEMVRSIQFLQDNRKYRLKLSKNVRKKAETLFSKETISKQWLNLINSL